MEEIEIGRGIQRAKVPVGQHRVRRRQIQPAGENGLKGVAGRDVFLDPPDSVLEFPVFVG